MSVVTCHQETFAGDERRIEMVGIVHEGDVPTIVDESRRSSAIVSMSSDEDTTFVGRQLRIRVQRLQIGEETNDVQEIIIVDEQNVIAKIAVRRTTRTRKTILV